MYNYMVTKPRRQQSARSVLGGAINANDETRGSVKNKQKLSDGLMLLVLVY
jgi:hypothetical protein